MFQYRYKRDYITIYFGEVFVANVDNWTEARKEEENFLENLYR